MLMLVVYYGYIVLIVFDKVFFVKFVGIGVMSVGVFVGMVVIVFIIVIIGIYVCWVNSEYD